MGYFVKILLYFQTKIVMKQFGNIFDIIERRLYNIFLSQQMEDSNKSQNVHSRSSSTNLSRTQSRKNFHLELVKFLRGSSTNDSLTEMREIKFLLAYLGRKIINGYRIQEIYNNGIILMNMMQFNCHNRTISNNRNSLFPRFLIIYPSTTDISRDPQFRVTLYQQIKKISDFLQIDQTPQNTKNVQINLLYLCKYKFSRMSSQDLNRSTSPDVKPYFFDEKNISITHNASSPVDNKEQGDRHHKLVQAFLKGNGRFLNERYISTNILGNIKFKYTLQFILNTICFVIGKQCIENNYVAITSEKWMRRCTKKLFKRYDLILRNQNQVCVLDWKFSMLTSDKVIARKKHQKTNRAYYELAKQQYKADVTLKYVCMNSQYQDSFYHQTSIKEYEYVADTVDIQQPEQKEQKEQQSSDVQIVQNERVVTNQNNCYVIEDQEQINQSKSNSKHSVFKQSSRPIISRQNNQQSNMINQQSSLSKIFPQKKRQKKAQTIDLLSEHQQQQMIENVGKKSILNRFTQINFEQNGDYLKALDRKRRAKQQKILSKTIEID